MKILLSYWYYKDVDLDALFDEYFSEPYQEVFADSGGFSAETQGVDIDWRQYVDWLKRWQHLFVTYANLDVIGNADATQVNQERLEESGLSPLPVFHVGSDYAVLEDMVQAYRYVALGGLVPHMRYTRRIMPHLVKCFKIAEGKAALHGFGVTSWQVLRVMPWYSVDSSSWGQGFRYGQVPIFDEQKGRWHRAMLGDKRSCYKVAPVIRRLGFDPEDFADRKRNDRAKICAISALSYMLAERWLRQLHGEVTIPGDGGKRVDPRAYHADANPKHFIEAAKGRGERSSHISRLSTTVQPCF